MKEDYSSKEFWNNRYITSEIGWDIGYPSTPLKTYFDQLTNKDLRILIPGCGNAYEGAYLFNAGFKNVFLLDFSEKALQNFSDNNPDFPAENLIYSNFFEHNADYDLIIEQTFFCAIPLNLREKYAEKANKLLKTNGKLAGLLFNDFTQSDKPPFGGTEQEYRKLFEKFFLIRKLEPCYNSIPPRENRELFIILEKKHTEK
jgi:methyl halide transferase